MSIKAYMFLVFGALILLLGGTQVFITHYFKSQLQTELAQTSKVLSENLVNVVIEQADQLTEFAIQSPQIEHHIDEVELLADQLEGVDEAIFTLDEEIKQIANDIEVEAYVAQLDPKEKQAQKARTVELKAKVAALLAKEKHKIELHRQELIEARRQTAKEYQQKLQSALKNIEISTESWVDDGKVMVVKTASDTPIHFARDISIDSQGAKEQLERFSESMLLLIVATCVLALLLAYWLSHHVSRPLSQLSQGHRRLGEGQLGIELKEQGVAEIKQILAGFNHMSRQLLRWTEKEQLMNQQKHLADLGQITRGIAHSLRNPLHTLGLLSDALSHEQDSDTRLKMSQKIQQKINLLDKSIQSLLTLSSDAMDRSRQIPLNQIVQDILIELSIAGLKPQVEFNDSDISYSVPGAEAELRAIIHAVMINAVEAQPQTPRIAINMQQKDEKITVQVTDWGEGISPEVAARLFEPHITTKAEGSGMGVYIAKRLLESHYGGALSYCDNPEGGTIATIVFSTSTNNNQVGAS